MSSLCLLPLLLAGAGSITLIATPAEPVLGTDTSVVLELEAPADATELRVFASRGRVEQLTAPGPGGRRAVYFLPSERVPQWAVLIATASSPRGQIHGVLVVPLLGQAVANVKAGAREPVTLHVGARTFGPVAADDEGRARIPILVPPGVEEARHRGGRVHLGVPPVQRLFAVVDRTQLTVDEAAEALVYLVALGREGAPRATPISLSSDRGTVGEATPLSAGLFAARWRFEAGRPGRARLSASFDGAPGPAVADVELVAGPARTFELIAPELVHAGDEALELEVRALDAAGNPAVAELRASTALGAVALTERSPGRYGASLPLDPSFAGRTELELQLTRGGTQVGATRVRLVSGPAAHIEVLPSAAEVTPDGRAPAAFQLAVSDRFGNPVSEPPVVTWRGVATPVQALGPGTFEAALLSGAVEQRQESTLEVRAGAAAASARLRLEPRWNTLTLGARGGVFTNAHDVLAPSAGLELAVWLRQVGLTAQVGYLAFAGPTHPELVSSTQVLLGLVGAAWRFFRDASWRAWVDGAGGVAVVQHASALGAAPLLEESRAVFAARVSLGAGYRLGPGFVALSLHATYLHDPGLLALRGALGGAGLEGGYRVDLF